MLFMELSSSLRITPAGYIANINTTRGYLVSRWFSTLRRFLMQAKKSGRGSTAAPPAVSTFLSVPLLNSRIILFEEPSEGRSYLAQHLLLGHRPCALVRIARIVAKHARFQMLGDQFYPQRIERRARRRNLGE